MLMKIIGTFSYDSKIVWNPDFRGFSNLVEDVVVADAPKPSIPYVDEEKLAETEQENRERIKETKRLSEELNKLLKEVASITGKHVAAKELKNKFSEDSNLHAGFTNIEINYESLIAKRDKLFKNMTLLDKFSDAERQLEKHEDTYKDAYENYFAYIRERIEANEKEVRKNQYQASLKAFYEFKNEFAFIAGKSMAGSEIKKKVPKDSNLYKEFED